jgi:LmbE family N-acetylglucosaminyl deacetylase
MRVLLTAAHPDDCDFACGGTVARLTGDGHNLVIAVASSGTGGLDLGSADPELRLAEQRAAADVLGVAEVFFLGFPDGAISADSNLRRALTRVIRQVRPDLVITHTPLRNLRSVRSSHPDHLAVGEATMAAIYPDARNPSAYPELLAKEGLRPHTVGEVWIHGNQDADHYVEMTEKFELKLTAIRCHASQLVHLDSDVDGFFRTWGEEVAQRHGLRAGSLAEEYLRLDTW